MKASNQCYTEQNFRDDDLEGALFENCQFYRCDFNRANLSDATFINCQFIERGDTSGCHFDYANLKEASFQQCDLSMAVFTGTQCYGIEFRDCQLQGADFGVASFAQHITDKTFFCSAFITKCNLSYANLENAKLEKCELFENRWRGANLSGASFKGSDLSHGEFSGEVWRQGDFRETNLSHVDLSELDLRFVDIKDATICAWQQEQLLASFGIIVGND